MRKFVEYWLARGLIGVLGGLPRTLALGLGSAIGWIAFTLLRRMRRVGMVNLRLAYPAWDDAQREAALRKVFDSLGRQLAEFCQMSRYTRENTADLIRYQGLEHYLAAKERGKGVLIVTGHLGMWELSSFYHSMMGHPMSMVIRRLDNDRVDAMVNRIRCLHGNHVVHKNDFARGLLLAMRQNETVGILMDTNMTPPQGVFVPFFGVQACTASGLARVALRTDAAVLAGFMVWSEVEKKYVLEFGAPLPLVRTGDADSDVVANTALFTHAIEERIRQYPEQWLWVHRRWKTRPAGEASLY